MFMQQSAQRSAGVGINPMVRVASVEDIERSKQAEQASQAPDLSVSAESMLAGHIRKQWQTNKIFKEKVSLRLLKALRARRGVYSAAELAQMEQTGGLNFVWVDLTETKCRAASAWIREVLMPVGDRPWMLKPSPMPDLAPEQKREIVQKAAAEAQQAMVAVQQAGGGVMSREEFRSMAVEIGEKLRDQVTQRYMKEATRRADRMTEVIADCMAEGGWEEAMDAFIEDFVTYPAAILKGPFYSHKRQLKWLPGWQLGVENAKIQKWARVDPFDAFPAPYARDCQHGDFIERVRYTRSELFDCIGLDDFREDEIRKALRDYTRGHLEAWLWTEAERQRLQQDSYYTWLSPAGVIDALHYWGSVPGFMLMSWGVKGWEELDPVREYEVDAILIGPYVIRCAINRDPLGQRPYWKACYDATPGAFWGRSVPDLAETCQKMVNAAASALADNMGMASGAMLWVHVDRLADGEDTNAIFPWRVFQLKSDATQGVNPGIGALNISDNSVNLMATIEKWEIKADDATGIPRYTYGNERVGGAADTYSGLSMLMNNAAKGLRRAIGNVDVHVIQPTVGMSYVLNMLYYPDPTVKGDCVPVPRGAAAILVKEAQTQAKLQALALVGSNPEDMAIVGKKGRAKQLRDVFKAIEVDSEGIVPTDDQIEQRMRQEQEAAMQQAQQQQAAQEQALQLAEAAKAQDQAHAERMEQIKANARLRELGANIAGKVAIAREQARAKPKAMQFDYDEAGNIARARTEEPAEAEE